MFEGSVSLTYSEHTKVDVLQIWTAPRSMFEWTVSLTPTGLKQYRQGESADPEGVNTRVMLPRSPECPAPHPLNLVKVKVRLS